jgi:hypothetical protein
MLNFHAIAAIEPFRISAYFMVNARLAWILLAFGHSGSGPTGPRLTRTSYVKSTPRETLTGF